MENLIKEKEQLLSPPQLELNVYGQILEMFKNKESTIPSYNWTLRPFTYENWNIATDSITLVFMPNGKADEYPDADDSISVKTQNNLNEMVSFEPNMEKEFKLSDLKTGLAQFDLIDEMVENESDEDCEACEGEGKIEANYYHKGKDYDIEAECPICDGSGENGPKNIPTGRKVFDPNNNGQIGNCIFSNPLLFRLYRTAQILGVSNIKILKQTTEYDPTFFEVGEAIVVLMPVINPLSKYIKFKIEI